MSGWHLLDPRWLWALGALAVPIVIHLISRGTARRVAIGSIGLLRPHESRRARRLRPTEWGLLLLRCLLVAVLVLILAGLIVPRPSAGEPTWGLISADVAAKRAAGQLDDVTMARLDALRAAGRLRRLAPGLPVDRDDAQPRSTATAPTDVALPEDVWSYLRQAESVAPPGTRLEVFAHDRLSHLRGARPTIATQVSWASLTPVSWATLPSVSREIDASTESPPWSSPRSPSPPPSTQRRIVLRHGTDRADDASYVMAALRSVQAEASFAIDTAEVDTADDAGTGATLADILVWLSDEPVPGTWRDAISAGATLLRDQGGRWSACATSVTGDRFGASGRLDGPPVRFQRARCLESVPPSWKINDENRPVSTVQTVWRDAHDRSVLTRLRVGEGTVWTFAGRFHPAWATLVLSPSFPRWVAAWLGEIGPSGAPDATVSVPYPAGEQRLPRRVESASVRASLPARTRSSDDTPSPLWWLVAVMVVIERAAALRVGR